MRTRTRMIIGTAAAVGLTAAIALPAAGHPGRHTSQAQLEAINGSGGTGTATIVDSGDEWRVNLDAEGLLDEATHLQHIHGFADGSTSAACPTPDQDENDDGFVDLAEGAVTYGGILVDLGSQEGAEFDYSRTYEPAGDLNDNHIVVHGVDVDGDGDLDGQKDVNGDGEIGGTDNPVLNLTEQAFELTMPALCGEIDPTGNRR